MTGEGLYRLVERFERNKDDYKSGRFSEAQVRVDFINPLWELLGWDVYNRRGMEETYREVISEDRVRVGGGTKAPDYGFYLGGSRRFFLEAKKPSVDISGEVSPAVQLRRYAWSAGLPLSLLTDFEELAVYDCRVRPKSGDAASTARLDFFTYDRYPERWDDIYSLFSREAVMGGSLERYAEEGRKKRGTETVDDAFLREIERWRASLARDIASRNRLSARQLNHAVQMTIDRIIFLRMAEDRGVEEYGKLAALLKGPGVYGRLVRLLADADDRYNSGLFHFKAEKDRSEEPDELTLRLEVGDEVLEGIIGGLYYPQSPYEFSVLPVDVLGAVYERFLGSVIGLEDGAAEVEQKPEVRKAGGVYYTPTYIVEHVVENTVGELVKGKKPGPRGGASKVRIVDPACGSGSFLIGAYEYLLGWHRDRYVEDGPEKHSKELYQGMGGQWLLTTGEKRRILKNNIYGVDIDPQAVEVTKLSLLLKVLEGESQESIEAQLSMFNERALPDLSDNIKCGNSLIGPDFYDTAQMSLLDEEDHYRINVFDWRQAFSAVFEEGGFDAVIGNPPYIRIQSLKEFSPVEAEHYKRAYSTAAKGNYDIYVVFVEQGLNLLNNNGRLGYILPHKFFNAKYGEPLRALISGGNHLSRIVHFGDEQVFAGATTYTALLFLDRSGNSSFRFVAADDLTEWRAKGEAEEGDIPAEAATAKEWNFVIGERAKLFERLREMPVKLGDVAKRMAQGIRTSANEIYVLDLVEDRGELITAYSKQLGKDVELERAAVSLFLQGREIKPYEIQPSGKVVIVPYSMRSGRGQLIPEQEYGAEFPKALAYLRENKAYLEDRERGRMQGEGWYAYVYPKNIDVMTSQKILVPDIADRASFALDDNGEYAFTSGYGITLKEGVEECKEYVLGLLNSRLLDFYLKAISTTLRGGFFRYFTQYIEQLPIRTIDFSDPQDAARHDEMVGLVEEMADLHQKLAEARIEQERRILGQRIAATDRRIDRLVYELYGLTEEEIEVIEREDG